MGFVAKGIWQFNNGVINRSLGHPLASALGHVVTG
jgi:hypothetical protein